MVLSRLTYGLSSKTLASRYSLEPYLISKITNMVTRLLATKLYPEFIKIPISRRRLHKTTQAFEELTFLPNMCGAIDSSRQPPPPPLTQSSTYHSRHGYPSRCRSQEDFGMFVLRVWRDRWPSHLRIVFCTIGLLGDVVWDKVINVEGHHVGPFIVGDWCYPLLSFLLTPFTWDRTAHCENEFDAALIKERIVVEEAIGLLKGGGRFLRT
ncbi:Protein ANTAGONIST OF LIKE HETEROCHROMATIN PROTEIN 1 [Camellia lanceoleosa]|uniref:Protein ANTAGONIST OF LIKE HETEROCHROMATIN PROTEIN 1 n=1 Tax=Camellia lanceoleosa TaxID=1840588 RepID=A0ACC0HK67_9ERIC|nr:Protein ANTAGONIST OF LIKE HETEROCHROMATIN PROTEIN 1 [Camellia lanceoleosa]